MDLQEMFREYFQEAEAQEKRQQNQIEETRDEKSKASDGFMTAKQAMNDLFGELSDDDEPDAPQVPDRHAPKAKFGFVVGASIGEVKPPSAGPSKASATGSSSTLYRNLHETSITDTTICAFGCVRVTNLQQDQNAIQHMMEGKKLIPPHLIPKFVAKGSNDIEDDWITVGVIIEKMSRDSKSSGKAFTIFKISDLTDPSKVVSVLCFGESHGTHWKLQTGIVIGLLNPKIKSLQDKKYQEVCTLQLDNPLKLLVMGTSVDFGRCKSIKKNGEPCLNVINKSTAPVCIFHLDSEYKKMTSKRPDLKSTYSGIDPNAKRFNSQSLKIDGQTGADGGFCTNINLALLGPVGNKYATQALKEKKAQIDSGTSGNSSQPSGPNDNPDIHLKSRKELKVEKDAQLAKFLQQQEINKMAEAKMIKSMVSDALTFGARNLAAVIKKNQPEDVTETMKKIDPRVNDKRVSVKSYSNPQQIFKQMRPVEVSTAPSPKLGRGMDPKIGFVDWTKMDKMKDEQIRRAAAEKLAKMNQLKRIDAKSAKKLEKKRKLDAIAARVSSSIQDQESQDPKVKKRKEDLDRLNAAINRKTKHEKEVDLVESQELQKYFSIREKKELLDEKRLSLMKITVKIFSCDICRYKHDFVSPLCKEKKHHLTISQGVKRAFKCSSCQHVAFTFDEPFYTKMCQKPSCRRKDFKPVPVLAPHAKAIVTSTSDLTIRGKEHDSFMKNQSFFKSSQNSFKIFCD